MATVAHAISQTVHNFWIAVTTERATSAPAVVIHDPAAKRPHDLDDPFFDCDVQARAADVISTAGRKN